MLVAQTAPPTKDPDFPREVSSHIERAFFGGRPVSADQAVHEAYTYHFQNPGGGSRMRLAFHCASLLGIDFNSSCRLAASVECLHNASLIQDDLQDRSLSRRGRQTVAMKFGNDVALGFTNQLVCSAFVCVSNESLAPMSGVLIRKIHQAVAETVDGQTSELLSGTAARSLESRLASSVKKSGPLFSLALELPLILAGYDDYLDLARQAAMDFGLGYQLLDDLNDQERDADAGSHGNLVLAMRAEFGTSCESAALRATDLARNLLHGAAEKAGRLPRESGRALIELVNDHLALLSASDQ